MHLRVAGAMSVLTPSFSTLVHYPRCIQRMDGWMDIRMCVTRDINERCMHPVSASPHPLFISLSYASLCTALVRGATHCCAASSPCRQSTLSRTRAHTRARARQTRASALTLALMFRTLTQDAKANTGECMDKSHDCEFW
jgi:hypothetical protein